MSASRRILVIRPDRIGDVTLATPVIRALRKSFPDAYIGAMVRPATETILRHNPHLDAILIDDWEREHAGFSGFRDRLRMLREHRFDTALMLLPKERHAWMTLLAGIRTRLGVGTKLYQLLTFTRGISRHKYIPLRHEADYCLDLARAVGAEEDGLGVEVFLLQEEREAAQKLLAGIGRDPARPLLSVHPESGRSSPNWDGPTYRDFVRACAEALPDLQVMVQITRSNTAMLELFEPLRSDQILLPDDGGDLRMVMGLIAEADAALASSTGPMHLAAGLGVPTASVFCPLPACHPTLWGPQGNRNEILMPPDEYCRTRCPGDPHICTMDGAIAFGDMISAIDRLISQSSSRPSRP